MKTQRIWALSENGNGIFHQTKFSFCQRKRHMTQSNVIVYENNSQMNGLTMNRLTMNYNASLSAVGTGLFL